MDIQGLISAFHTITALPVPGKGCERAEDSLVWFPWVGFAIGVVLASLAWLGCADWIDPRVRLFWVFILAAVTVAVWVLITRGFHLDGLADMCDGFGGGWTRERVLEIMRDPHIGSFGVIALILGLLIKILAAAMLIGAGRWLSLAAVPIAARWAMVYQAVFNVYARRDVTKVSMANHFIDKAKAVHFCGASFHAILALGLLVGFAGLPLYSALAAVLAAWAAALLIGWISRRKIGGVTGDILGATCELAETAALIITGLL